MEPKPTYTPEEKLRWEIEKLQAETRNLKRPWIGNPASWFTIITTVVALTTVVIQCTKSSNEYNINQIKTEQLKLERTQIETQNANIRKQNDTIREQTEQLEKARQVIVSQIAQANVEFSRLDNLITRTRAQADSMPARPTEDQFQESKDVLTTISAALQSPASSAQFVSVISTLRTPERAVARAKGIKETSRISYPINVYQKAPGQYVLTLGGKLTYVDASSRVEYAKQNNYPDAVVRLAKNWGENLNK